jgi:TRAP-type C4-dicarboxylate transport system substrate-binding protein
MTRRKETPEERKAFREAINEVRSWKRQAQKDRETRDPEELHREFMETAAKYHLNVVKPESFRRIP